MRVLHQNYKEKYLEKQKDKLDKNGKKVGVETWKEAENYIYGVSGYYYFRWKRQDQSDREICFPDGNWHPYPPQ